MATKLKEQKIDERREKYYFFLNPYEEYAFTKCPKCEGKTKLKKFALVVHVEPNNFFILNKKCRYCPRCELIIVKKTELESFLIASIEKSNPELKGNDYLVLGTIDREDWKRISREELPLDEIKGQVYIFKDELNFKVIPAGWYPKEE